MSAFFIQFSLVSVMLSRRVQRTQKALRTRGTHQKLLIFSDTCNQCKVPCGKACTRHSMIDFRGGIQKILITGIQLVHTDEANNLLLYYIITNRYTFLSTAKNLAVMIRGSRDILIV